MKTVLLLNLICIAFGSPFDVITEKFHELKNKITMKSSFNYAATVDQLLPATTFNCMRQGGYSSVFVRAYQLNDTGNVDYNGIQNIKNANSVNLGVEVYAVPQPQSDKTATTQFDEMYSALKNSGINLQAIWLQVTSPINWPNSHVSNINFITSFLSRARQYGLVLGVFTNWYDWQQITGGYNGLSNLGTVRLWYWNAYGTGVSAASSLDFTDFRAFGSWSSAVIKQYSFLAGICGAKVNQNIYSTSTSKRAMAIVDKANKIPVGVIEFRA